MIDWFGLFYNVLWLLGAAMMLGALSYGDWWRRIHSPKLSLRQTVDTPGFQLAFTAGAALFCAGLALGSDAWWQVVAWGALGVLFAGQAVLAWHRLRRHRNEPN